MIWNIPVAQMPQAFQWISIVLWGAGAAVLLGYGLILWKNQKTLYAIYTLVGSMLAIPYEALNNILGRCLHPQVGQITAVTVFGQPIPVWTMLAYAGYFAIPVVLLIELMIARGKLSTKAWWITFFAAVVGACAVEVVFVNLGVWTYYGDNQPVKLLGTVPIWWGFVNASSILTVTALVYGLKTLILTPKIEWLLVPLFPLIVFAAHGAPSLVAWFAISSSDSLLVTNGGAVVSTLLALVLVGLDLRVIRFAFEHRKWREEGLPAAA